MAMLTNPDLRARIRQRAWRGLQELDEAALGHEAPSLSVSKFL